MPTAQPQDLLSPAALLESTVLRDPAYGTWTDIGIRADVAAPAVELNVTSMSEGTSDVSHVRHDSSSVAQSSGSVAAAVQGADVPDVRPAPECSEPRLRTAVFP